MQDKETILTPVNLFNQEGIINIDVAKTASEILNAMMQDAEILKIKIRDKRYLVNKDKKSLPGLEDGVDKIVGDVKYFVSEKKYYFEIEKEDIRYFVDAECNYEGQGNATHFIGDNNRPIKVGRVLDDGSTQLTQFKYNAFGKVTKSIDPLGRTLSYVYSDDGIDLLEVRQTRAGYNELLARVTYNQNHLPLTVTDAAGQTTTNTYNARGQLLTTTDPDGETTTNHYDTNGYLIAIDGPLPGTNDTVHATYDVQGRMFTKTDTSGYTVTMYHDAMDRLTNITFPDGTFSAYIYDRLDVEKVRDRAGREALLEHDNMRQLAQRTDPLGRVTRFQWCSCGDISSMIDPMGRTTSWHKDVQGRLVAKEYGDGSRVNYLYERSTSRLRQIIDEKGQITQFTYNLDDTLRSQSYANTAVSTPSVSYVYDPNYGRKISMTDGIGTTHYTFVPVTQPPTLGAGQISSIDGPLLNDTITYQYDSHGQVVLTAINGVAATVSYDEAGRMTASSNALGNFAYTYDGVSGRLVSQSFPNNLTLEQGFGNQLQDFALNRITYKLGTNPVSEFLYGRNIPAAQRIETWAQQAGALSPDVHTFGYDAADQLTSAVVTNLAVQTASYQYAYDVAGNRLLEQINGTNFVAAYNALNQLTTITNDALTTRTNEWDGQNRVVAVNESGRRTEFSYYGDGKLASIRLLTNNVEASFRRFVWLGNVIAEERDAAGGNVAKRFFDQGMTIESGLLTGSYFYTLDHLGSVRELVDSNGDLRARYSFDPYGRRSMLSGDINADFGFAGMFWATEAGLNLTRHRAYVPGLGQWLSRDPLRMAEIKEGPNLYSYVKANPINLIDPLGLESFECCRYLGEELDRLQALAERVCEVAPMTAGWECQAAVEEFAESDPWEAYSRCVKAYEDAAEKCRQARANRSKAAADYNRCLEKPCDDPCGMVLPTLYLGDE